MDSEFLKKTRSPKLRRKRGAILDIPRSSPFHGLPLPLLVATSCLRVFVCSASENSRRQTLRSCCFATFGNSLCTVTVARHCLANEFRRAKLANININFRKGLQKRDALTEIISPRLFSTDLFWCMFRCARFLPKLFLPACS